jgi:tetratricopeptide (TPR) repeat protein
MARAHHQLAVIYGGMRRFDDAMAAFERSRRVAEATFPPRHRTFAQLEHSVGETLLLAGRAREALVHLERANDIARDALPLEHPLQASIASATGRALLVTGDARAARAALERAMAAYPKHAEEPPVRADTEFALARTLTELRVERPRALALARAARDGFTQGNALYAPELREVEAWLAAHAPPDRPR